MIEENRSIEGLVQIGGNATILGSVVGVNNGTITTIVQAAHVATSLHQLRAPVGDFIGRQPELSAVLAALRPPTLDDALHVGQCVIQGMGGIGKTELALRAAHMLRDTYPDAQLFISLRGSKLETTRAVSDALGDIIHAFSPLTPLPTDGDALAALYRGYLSGKRALIVLDDVPDAGAVRPFLPPAGCALIVTSRTRLSLAGELTVVDLELLTRPQSCTLLTQLAPRLAESPALDALLAYCHDLPLALRVVGATFADNTSLTPERYLSQLADEARRLKVLRYDDLDVYAIIGVGDDLLADRDARLARRWRMLGICVAPFDAATAASIWGEADEYELDVQLSQLVRRSLVIYDHQTGRYHIHDLLRDVALGRCDEQDEQIARARHAGHYLALYWEAQHRYDGGDARSGLALFDASWLHIREGALWIAAHPSVATDPACIYDPRAMSLLNVRLQPRELKAWCQAAVASARRRGHDLHEMMGLQGLGTSAHLLGDAPRALDAFEESLRIARQLSDRRGEGQALLGLGKTYQFLGAWQRAGRIYRETLAMLQQERDSYSVAVCQEQLGALLVNTMTYDEALQQLEQAKTTFEACNDRLAVGRVLEHLSFAYLQHAQNEQALACAQAQLRTAEEYGDQVQQCIAVYNMGTAYFRQNSLDEAMSYLQDALDRASDIRYERGVILAGQDLAGVYANQGQFEKSLQYLQQALDAATKIGYQQAISFIVGNAGYLYAAAANYDFALACNVHSLRIAVDLGDQQNILANIGKIAAIFVHQQRWVDAELLYQRAIAMGRKQNLLFFLCAHLYGLAELYALQQRDDEAQAINEEAGAIAAAIGHRARELQIKLLALRLAVQQRQMSDREAIEALKVLATAYGDDVDQAEIEYELWLLDSTEQYRIAAANKYHSMYLQTPDVQYRDRYTTLTGNELPLAPPLPLLQNITLGEPIDAAVIVDMLGP